jgi:hypothetical protein
MVDIEAVDMDHFTFPNNATPAFQLLSDIYNVNKFCQNNKIKIVSQICIFSQQKFHTEVSSSSSINSQSSA